MKTCLSLIWAIAAGQICMAASAAEVSLSGFGTVGYAKSDQSYNYQRFINKNGTFMRDSVFGAQMDVKVTEQWGATVQGKFAPSLGRDTGWDSTLSWAFASWRPANDWLVRLGKQRVGLYLFSESQDVGETYDFAHLPTEMYSISPSSDYVGASVSKTWNPSVGEVTVDVYSGTISTKWRIYQRDNTVIAGSSMQPGGNFKNISVNSTGFALTWQRDEDKYRASVQTQTTAIDPSSPAYYSRLTGAQIDPRLTGATSGTAYSVLPQALTGTVKSVVVTLGTEIHLLQDFRLIGEYGRRQITNALNGIDTTGGYLALLKDVDGWTPYVSYAQIKSSSDSLSLYQAMNSNAGLTDQTFGTVPPVTGAVNAINASQRVLADGLLVYDQSTVALGTSYRITHTQKIKAEWARTHVGVASSFVDVPSGSDVSNQNIDVLSLSYNIVF